VPRAATTALQLAVRVNCRRYHIRERREYITPDSGFQKTEERKPWSWIGINTIRKSGGRVGELGKLSPDTLRGYQTLKRRQLEDDQARRKRRVS